MKKRILVVDDDTMNLKRAERIRRFRFFKEGAPFWRGRGKRRGAAGNYAVFFQEIKKSD